MEYIRKEEIKDYAAFIENSVARRVEAYKARSAIPNSSSNPVREDMFHFLLTAVDPDTGLPAFSERHNLLAETRLLVVAGTDTTALTLSAWFFYLAHYPRVLSRLTNEVRSTFLSPEEIALGTTLSKCKYLRACIDETLRISHPAPGELPREILKGGAIIDGHPYPAGTLVGCAAWSLGRDESVYGDCNVFRPERWIPSSNPEALNTEADVLRLRKAFHPFSIGPMNCAGQSLAVLELLLVTAKTVWTLDFRLAPGQTLGEGRPELGWGQRNPKEYVVKDTYLAWKYGPIIQFRKRPDVRN